MNNLIVNVALEPLYVHEEVILPVGGKPNCLIRKVQLAILATSVPTNTKARGPVGSTLYSLFCSPTSLPTSSLFSASIALCSFAPHQFPSTVAIARLAGALRPVSVRPYQRILLKTARRGYASAGSAPKKAASSDIPWSVPRHPRRFSCWGIAKLIEFPSSLLEAQGQ